MENYTITKEQILELEKTFLTNESLREWFPDAFKKDLEVGKWYTLKEDRGNILVFIKSLNNNTDSYGLTYAGTWFENSSEGWTYIDSPENWREATPQEVETALRAEAKKRGFVNGAIGNNSKPNNYNCMNDKLNFVGIEFDAITNELRANNNDSSYWIIFRDGKWATIIPEETKVITIDKAVKILSKKYGQQVEIK